MELQVAKWGNSLAFRIPLEIVRSMKLRPGEHLRARILPDGSLIIKHPQFDRKQFAEELRQHRKSMAKGETVMNLVRGNEGWLNMPGN